MSNKVEDMSFEEAFAALGETLEKLEAGDLPLAKALALYEHGMALAQHCNVQLDSAELKIKKLTPSGEVESFEGE
jgi:exodeoxyribonuclease VII small subunit